MSAGATELTPELFEHGCDRRLPVSRVLDEYEIGEVIPLRVAVGEVWVPVLLDARGKKQTVDDLVINGQHRDWKGQLQSYASALGGVSADDLADDKVSRSLEPLVETVVINSLLDVLATSRVKVGDTSLTLHLTPNASRSLLRGEPALVLASGARGAERRVEIVPAPANDGEQTDAGKASSGKADARNKYARSAPSVVIHDLGEFLALRTVDLGGVESGEVKLTAAQVRNLVSRGQVEAKVGETTVALQVREPEAGLLLGTTPDVGGSGALGTSPQVARFAATSTPAPTSVPPAPPGSSSHTPPPPPPRPQFNSLPLALYLPVRHTWELLRLQPRRVAPFGRVGTAGRADARDQELAEVHGNLGDHRADGVHGDVRDDRHDT